jgi:hypothetical protein
MHSLGASFPSSGEKYQLLLMWVGRPGLRSTSAHQHSLIARTGLPHSRPLNEASQAYESGVSWVERARRGLRQSSTAAVLDWLE